MIIGLTGKIGAGKSFVACCFKKLGAAVFDADSIVHKLYEIDKNIINYAEKNLSGAVNSGRIERSLLSQYFLAYDENWRKFESLIHSAVIQELRMFLFHERRIKRDLLILDIPLLLETKLHLYCDFLGFIHANRIIQNRRCSIDTKKFRLMCDIQFPTKLKKKLSNFTIDTGVSRGYVFSQVKAIINFLRKTNL